MKILLTYKCTHCGGVGIVAKGKLPLSQRRIIDMLRDKWLNGVEENDLLTAVYLDRKAPFYPLLSVQAAIRALNRRMQGRKIVLKTNKIGKPNRRYHLLRTTEGEQHGEPNVVRRRNVPRVKHNGSHHGGIAVSKAE